jgi:hypothetical protein
MSDYASAAKTKAEAEKFKATVKGLGYTNIRIVPIGTKNAQLRAVRAQGYRYWINYDRGSKPGTRLPSMR